jgi:hypothetical protein
MTVNKRGDFHKLTNLNSHPDYHHKAQENAREYLEKVTVDSFSYSNKSLKSWLQEEHSRSIASMKKPHWLDHGCTYSGNCYGPFSNEAIRERLLQNAPNNLIDGAWLDRIMPCGTATLAEGILFRIRYEEAGNGDLAMHHPNVYSNLLHNQEINLSSVYTRKFSEDSRFIDEAFEQPVFQLSVGLFPRQFLPELLGMTLWFEWSSTPSSCQLARCLRGRNIDDTYYKIHQQTDNPTNGHGFLARHAVEVYLEGINSCDVQQHWHRIYNAYYVWDRLSIEFENRLQDHLVVFDKKQEKILSYS